MFFFFFLREDNDLKKDNDNKERKTNINQIQESKYRMTTHKSKRNTKNPTGMGHLNRGDQRYLHFCY